MSQFRNIIIAGQDAPDQPIPDIPADIPANGIVLSDKSWFDTGIVRSDDSVMRLECDTSSLDTRYYSTMFGDNYSAGNCLYVRVNTKESIDAYDCKQHILDGYNVKGINVVEANIPARNWNINGTAPQAFVGFSPASGSTLSIYLGAFHKSDNSVNYSANGLRILRFSHWKSGQLIQQLVAHKDANGTPCLLDTVTGSIIYNKGTGKVTYL